MNTTFLIDDRLVFHSGQNSLASVLHPDLTEILNEPCARCLEALLAAQGKVVSQAELYKAGWGEANKSVSPNTLYQNILLARKAFRKVADSDDEFIITVPRQGFRFNETLAVTVSDTPNNCTPVMDEFPSKLNKSKNGNVFRRWTFLPLQLCHSIPASLLVILLAAVIFIFSSFNYVASRHDDFTADYSYVGKHAGCEIYIDKLQPLSDVNVEEILKRWPDIFSNCGRLPLRYITPYRTHLSVFYLSCDSNNKAEKICNSGYRRLSE